MERIEVGGLKVARVLHDFVNREALPGTGIGPEAFWTGLAAIIRDMAPRNRELLRHRDALQAGSTRITGRRPAGRSSPTPTRPSCARSAT
jgi:malate synthase